MKAAIKKNIRLGGCSWNRAVAVWAGVRRLDLAGEKEDGDAMRRMRAKTTGFTLVEILVVVSIIGLLAGLSIPAVGGALASARKSKTMTMAHQIRTALVHFNTEYGFFVTNVGAFNTDGVGCTQADLALVLTGSTNGSATNWNPRAIAFLEVPAEFTTNGSGNVTNGGIMTPKNLITKGPDKGKQLLFSVAVDHNYDGTVTVTNGTARTNISGSVAVWFKDPADTTKKTAGTFK